MSTTCSSTDSGDDVNTQDISITGRPGETTDSSPQAAPALTPRVSRPPKQGVPPIVIVGVVLPAIMGIIWAMLWSLAGGIAYQPMDRAVRNARAAADRTARADLDAIVDELAPAVGVPTLRAVCDSCTAKEMLDNRLSCVRYHFLYYPLEGQVPEAATVAGPISTTPWEPGTCYGETGTTSACRHTSSFSRNLTITVVSATADKYVRYLPGGSADRVEESGMAEMKSATATGAYVLVEYNTRYFSD